MKDTKKLFRLYQIGTIFLILCIITLTNLGVYLTQNLFVNVLFIIIGVVLVFIVIYRIILVELKICVFKCPHCDNLFTPTIFQYIKGYHTFTKRYLNCNMCGKKNMCKREIKDE